MPPLRYGGGITRRFCLTSVVYIGNNSRTERPRKTEIGTEVAHVTLDSDNSFKVKRSKVTRPVYSLRHLRTGNCSSQNGNVFSVGNCCYIAVCRHGNLLGSARRYGAHTGRRGVGALLIRSSVAYSGAATICPHPLQALRLKQLPRAFSLEVTVQVGVQVFYLYISSFKSAGLPVLKIWHIFTVMALNRPGDLDL